MIHFVVGTRAQLFKMAPIMRACTSRGLKWRWVYTAQHKETIANTLKVFELPEPDYTVFEWSSEAKTMGKVWYWLIRIMLKIFRTKKILGGFTGREHIVLTHGDTITTWWGALIGRLARCRVMHVEAGLRSFNIWRPFPEEINRLITFRLATCYGCPGDWACGNLTKYRGDKINTGMNTQIDTLHFGLKQADQADIDLPSGKYVVATIHRYENIFKREQFDNIIKYLEEIAADFQILFIQHPVTNEQIDKLGFRKRLTGNPGITLLPRLEYPAFIKAVKNAEFVISDGGGNQEELYHLGKPTLLFRRETERQEGLGDNVVLSKFNHAAIADFVKSYRNYQRPPVTDYESPSGIIADYLEREGYGR